METKQHQQDTTPAAPEVGDRVQVNDPWTFVSGAGTVTVVAPGPLASTVVTVALDNGRTTRTYPYYVTTVATATWCCDRNGYADDSAGCTATVSGHVHYDVDYNPDSGNVVTSPTEQAKRRQLAESAAATR